MAHPKLITKQRRRAELKTVPAEGCRARMLELSKHGVGRKAVHEFTGLDHKTLRQIRNGATKYVQRETQRLIFSVPVNAHCDKALVDANETWRRIDELVNRDDTGFTRSEIAKRIGRKPSRSHASLQLGKKRVIARTAMRIEKLYNDALGIAA